MHPPPPPPHGGNSSTCITISHFRVSYDFYTYYLKSHYAMGKGGGGHTLLIPTPIAAFECGSILNVSASSRGYS